jgi:hypothetical protein
MVLRETQKYKTRDGKPKKFYSCSRWPACSGIHGAHPNGAPMGIPGNAETKAWRIKAHAAFDESYKDLPRPERYKRLMYVMGLTEEEAHIARFDIDQCKRLIERLTGIKL